MSTPDHIQKIPMDKIRVLDEHLDDAALVANSNAENKVRKNETFEQTLRRIERVMQLAKSSF